MSECLYDELGEGEIDKRKRYQIPIFQSSHGSIITVQQHFPMTIEEWNRVATIVKALEGEQL